MDLSAFMKDYADQINGQYTEFSNSQSVIIVPVGGGRFQTVLGIIKQSESKSGKIITLASKVSEYRSDFDFQMLLEQTAHFNYSRFVIRDGYLQVEAVSALDGISEDAIKELVQEVANLADQYEMKLTGADVN